MGITGEADCSAEARVNQPVEIDFSRRLDDRPDGLNAYPPEKTLFMV